VSGWRPLLADTGLLTLFALHHSLFARNRVKAWMVRVVPARLERSVYVWIASALLILVCTRWRRVGGTIYDIAGWRAVAHAGLQLFGVWLIARSVAGIDPLELAGIREQASRGGLQTTGPYGWVRHPLYLGWVLAVFGAAHMTGDRVAFAVITTLYLMVAVPWEERSLREGFGDEYRAYQRRVRWRIVPYVF
jgi:methanethiol S-methyltransferase